MGVQGSRRQAHVMTCVRCVTCDTKDLYYYLQHNFGNYRLQPIPSLSILMSYLGNGSSALLKNCRKLCRPEPPSETPAGESWGSSAGVVRKFKEQGGIRFHSIAQASKI